MHGIPNEIGIEFKVRQYETISLLSVHPMSAKELHKNVELANK